MADGDWSFGLSVLVLAIVFGGIEFFDPNITVSSEVMLLLVISPYITLVVMIYFATVIVPRQAKNSSETSPDAENA